MGGNLGPNDDDGLMPLNVDAGRELKFDIGETASSDNPDGVLIRDNRLLTASSGSAGVTVSTGAGAEDVDRLNGFNFERHDGVCSTGSTGDEDFQRRNLIFFLKLNELSERAGIILFTFAYLFTLFTK